MQLGFIPGERGTFIGVYGKDAVLVEPLDKGHKLSITIRRPVEEGSTDELLLGKGMQRFGEIHRGVYFRSKSGHAEERQA